MSKHSHEHEHMDSCGCGHDHLEHHEHEHHDSCGCGHDHHEHEHHEHEHHDGCGCGHDHHEHEHHEHEHHDDCGCGHDHHEHHEHEHEHHDGCGCGHDHHEHEHHNGCGCGHDHHEHEHHNETGKGEKRVYILENLGCAHCASKMEDKIRELPGVASASITYATKQLRLTAENPDVLLPEIQKICTTIESQVKVIPRNQTASSAKTKTYILENLGCAHCASKMEEQINKIEGISNATITYATKQLRVTAANPDRYLPQIRKICTTIESQVEVIDRSAAPKAQETASASTQTTTTDSKKKDNKDTKELCQIGIGAVLFIIGMILHHKNIEGIGSIAIFVIGYLILGGKILLEAGRNILKGQVFDENFLMSVATLGAFAIQEFPEAMGVMLFYRVGEFFEHKAVDRSRTQIMDAVDMRPEVVNLVIADEIQVIPAEEAEIGDVLLIRPGDRIPLDGTVIEGESRLDTSPITGEPVPVAVKAGDEIVSGCVNTSGQLKIRVSKPLSESMVTRILDSVENAAASKPKIDRFITRFARVYTPFVVIAAVAVAVIPSIFTGNWNYWVYTALTFLVMSCPCALVLSVPLAFFSGIGAGSKKGILFKGGVAIEGLSNLKAVVMDKTGTITQGNFKLQKVVSQGSMSEKDLLRVCASCEQNSTHPIAHSIVTAASERNIKFSAPLSMKEIAGHGVKAELPEGTVLCGNRKLMEKYSINISNITLESYGAEVFLAVNGKLEGYFLISDTIKEDAKSAISRLKSLGLHTSMLTGDSENSAKAVAAETGIDEVHAKLLPQDKLDILTKIRSTHGTVMFVGDGINDAPVLAGADVGAAMGSGADAAIEAADTVFMTSSVESIPDAISIARSTNRIAMQNVVFALVIKVIVMILGLLGYANMWLAVFADTGVAMLCVLNSIRVLYKK